MAAYFYYFICRNYAISDICSGGLSSTGLILILPVFFFFSLTFVINTQSDERSREKRRRLSLEGAFNRYIRSVRNSGLTGPFRTVTGDGPPGRWVMGRAFLRVISLVTK